MGVPQKLLEVLLKANTLIVTGLGWKHRTLHQSNAEAERVDHLAGSSVITHSVSGSHTGKFINAQYSRG